MTVQSPHPYQSIFEQYIDDASFLWILRSVALRQPHYLPNDFCELEQRIDRHLSGLLRAPDIAWNLCQDALGFEEAGEVFVSAVVAFQTSHVKAIQTIVETGISNENTLKGLVSAMAWLPNQICHDWVKKFFLSQHKDHQYLAIATCSARRDNPAGYLTHLLDNSNCAEHSRLYARCLRAIGEFKRTDLKKHLDKARESDDESVQFWANWSNVLLGNRESVSSLLPFLYQESDCQDNNFQELAMQLIFRTVSVEEARNYITQLSKKPEHIRWVIKAIAILGDPYALTWVIKQMPNPELARLAGETFTTITGFELQGDLINESIEDDTVILNRDEQTEDGMDDDEHLPWPNTKKIEQLWHIKKTQFHDGQRYFMGETINQESLNRQLHHGFQRRRISAAYELALLNQNEPLVNVKARHFM